MYCLKSLLIRIILCYLDYTSVTFAPVDTSGCRFESGQVSDISTVNQDEMKTPERGQKQHNQLKSAEFSAKLPKTTPMRQP